MARPKTNPEFASCHPERTCYCKGLCKNCYSNQQAKKYYAANPEKYRARTAAFKATPEGAATVKAYNQTHGLRVRLKHRYNMTPEQYDCLFRKQHGVCAICQHPARGNSKLVVDHNHTTHHVRGLLCVPCNRTLGYFENPEWHQKADAYLAASTPNA